MNFSSLNKFGFAPAASSKEASSLPHHQKEVVLDYDNYIHNALAIWDILGISEQEYCKKYQPATDISNNFIIATDPLVGDVDIQTEK